MPKRWWQVLVWLWRGVITLEEGIFLFGQAWKRVNYSWPKKGYSLR
ncbi:MAG TPA: hypothetical protein GXZ98_05225 [Firmicutes bacterium]|jgi:hypothetical protein|nr:hypothetical protein [Bacillota bacterium]